MFFFFFQAEDGIRDKLVTGVQTCALPILNASVKLAYGLSAQRHGIVHLVFLVELLDDLGAALVHGNPDHREALVAILVLKLDESRNLDSARTAPGGPEIEQHHLALVVRQT